MEPLVSVIMPVYNTPEPILREAIESILNQTLKNFEFIIIDDCSKKSIQPVVDSYCDNRVIFLRNKENLGDNSDIDITFCIDCMKMAIQDYIEKFEKANKKKNEE